MSKPHALDTKFHCYILRHVYTASNTQLILLLLGLNRLLGSRSVGKLHTLLDVALKDRYELINSLLLNSIELTNATYILNTFGTKLDLQIAACSAL